MTDLPPLPAPWFHETTPQRYAEARPALFTADQMRAYGAACAAQEREKWEADAERWRYINTTNNIWRRDDRDEPCSLLCVVLPYGADLSCRATREAAIDAARARETP